jgi:D-alanyl-D-alanine carboxypeptidase (penicillin-binding protein 5/6)
MKAVENPDLKGLIERLEHRRLVRQTTTTTMAALGLIGFGVMMVPIFGGNHAALPIAMNSGVATTTPAGSAYQDLSLVARSAVVYDLATGKALYEKNANTQLPLASLTKLLTTYAAVTTLDKNTPITMSATAIAAEGDSGLSVGETFAFKDIVRYALVASSNDAAQAVAEAAAKTQDKTDTSLLASAAAAAGLSQKTYALNGTGLDESAKVSGGYGTAQDVALLSGALLKKARGIAQATIERSVTVTDYSGVSHTLPNTNQDIVHIPNPLLSKTGYTDLAGGNLVVVFDAGINHPVAVVVLGSTRDGRFTDVDTLVKRTLDHFAGVTP